MANCKQYKFKWTYNTDISFLLEKQAKYQCKHLQNSKFFDWWELSSVQPVYWVYAECKIINIYHSGHCLWNISIYKPTSWDESYQAVVVLPVKALLHNVGTRTCKWHKVKICFEHTICPHRWYSQWWNRYAILEEFRGLLNFNGNKS